MKKFLLFIFFGLLWGNTSNAQIINAKCNIGGTEAIFIIDLQKKTVEALNDIKPFEASPSPKIIRTSSWVFVEKSVSNGHVHRVYFFELNIETKKGKMILAHRVDVNKKIVKQKLKQNKTFDLLPILSDPPENIQTWDVSCEY